LTFARKAAPEVYLQHPDGSRAKIIISRIGMSGPAFLDDWSFRDFAVKKWHANEEERNTTLAARNAAVVSAQIPEQLEDYRN
jgi:hypothetical protein